MTSTSADAPFDVFLSYHSGDGEWVAVLRNRLAGEGIRVWLDSYELWCPPNANRFKLPPLPSRGD